MALVLNRVDHPQEANQRASGSRTGVRTAADFTIDLGFTPSKIRVVNLTDRIQAEHIVDSALGTSNAESLKTVAAGTVTYADCGIALTTSGLGFIVTVATAGLETDDDDVIWEAWN